MKSLPTHDPADFASITGKMPSLPAHIPLGGPAHSKNRRASSSKGDRAYPILLVLSTLLAAVFCYLYITKPVRILRGAADNLTPIPAALPATEIRPAPLAAPEIEKPLPAPSTTAAPRGNTTPFEETNLRVQHILTSESPNGELNKIILNIPVLYQSRNLRWTTADVLEARVLLNKLSDYQEKSSQLRAESVALLSAWNRLIERTIPAGDIRADSPSLPASQQSTTTALPADTQSIQLQPTGK